MHFFKEWHKRREVKKYRKSVNAIISTLTPRQQRQMNLADGLYLSPSEEKKVEKRFVIYGSIGDIVAFFDFIRCDNNSLTCAMAVDRAYQGHGYGKYLAEYAMKWFYDHGADYGTLNWKVRSDNRIAIYLANVVGLGSKSSVIERNNEWIVYKDICSAEKRKEKGEAISGRIGLLINADLNG